MIYSELRFTCRNDKCLHQMSVKNQCGKLVGNGWVDDRQIELNEDGKCSSFISTERKKKK